MKKRILCFGDSNTWGYDPGTAERFPEDVRWTSLLQSLLGPEYAVLEEGQNGRTTVFADPVEGSKSGMAYLEPCLETANPLQAVVIMLGTNDAKDRFGCNAYQISQSVKRLGEIVLRRDYAPYQKPELLIVSPIEINGGILAGNDIITDIPGLYAAGESMGGCHGANRMGGNAIMAAQVFGKLSANAAADYAKARGNTDDVTSEESLAMIEQACYSKERQGKMPPEKAMEAVQKIVQKAAFLERTEEKLNEGIRSLERLREAYAPMAFLDTPQAASAFSTYNAVCSALLMLTAMRERRETRGAHLRLDYPEKTDGNMRYVTFRPSGEVAFGPVR